jgi:hypothetical protein
VVSTRKDAKGRVECKVEQSTSRIVRPEVQGGMAGKVV